MTDERDAILLAKEMREYGGDERFRRWARWSLARQVGWVLLAPFQMLGFGVAGLILGAFAAYDAARDDHRKARRIRRALDLLAEAANGGPA